MLAAIAAATRSITFETYIYWSGKVGNEFAAALIERARAASGSTSCSIGSAANGSKQDSFVA